MSANQVWTWHQRTKTNGFPEPVDHKGKAGAPRFRLDDVLTWKRQYRKWASLKGQVRNPQGRNGKGET